MFLVKAVDLISCAEIYYLVWLLLISMNKLCQTGHQDHLKEKVIQWAYAMCASST
jgi:hypothetical protein